MKKVSVVLAAVFCFAALTPSYAMTMTKGVIVHEEVVQGVKAVFKAIDIREAMKGMEMHKGMKETHHLMVMFTAAESGSPLNEGVVIIKVQNPDKTFQEKKLMEMKGHFGSDFDFSRKGKYEVSVRFELKDGKIRETKFQYETR